MPARVYTLNHQQVPNPSKVVEDTIHVSHCLAKILTSDEIWELETDIQEEYPELFMNKCMNFEDEIFLRRRECDDLKICLYFLIISSYFE